jgi:hypothetical protein
MSPQWLKFRMCNPRKVTGCGLLVKMVCDGVDIYQLVEDARRHNATDFRQELKSKYPPRQFL